ncbi:sensor histidine kinase [Paenibacillus donghaensis]|nr:HAMP domain-containing sensor histidine kinase [Paenibacillus donghaensis]
MSKISSSLLSRYAIIVIGALLFIPVVFPLTMLGAILFANMNDKEQVAEVTPYDNISRLEKIWHLEALQLEGADADEIDQRLIELSAEYSRASLFWVDEAGTTRLTVGNDSPGSSMPIPSHWDAAEAISFMKSSMNRDPLAIMAFIGDRADAGQGFMAMQIPSAILTLNSPRSLSAWYSMVVVLLFFIGFVTVSLLFFIGIRKRLLRLQTAMTVVEPGGIPAPIDRGKSDEIGRLEEAFNTMTVRLESSRRREIEEEELRKRLVANLSHDLRTPMTVLRSHIHVITKEELSEQGRASLKLMDERIADLSVLIENLLSYNLLNSGRITLKRERKDVLRLLRESAAAWYPVWEKEGFEIDIRLTAEPLYWQVDEVWFRRILDNLYQNIVRHAGSGLYVGLYTGISYGHRAVIIMDRGKGIGSHSEAKGAGLGLSIVDLLLKQMDLDWKVDSTKQGTSIILFDPRPENLNKI